MKKKQVRQGYGYCGSILITTLTIKFETMTVEKIERAVAALPRRKLVEFSKWFEKYRANQWEDQVQKDDEVGHLDKHIEDAYTTPNLPARTIQMYQ